jgi:hypothetical protein
MQYQTLYLFDQNNALVGLAIGKTGVQKLQSLNYWNPKDSVEIDDFKRTLAGLNDEDTLRAFWPDADDPDVARLVEDPEWEPLELHEEDVPDWDASTVVDDEFGGIDQERSNIVFKKAQVPDPTEAQNRYFKAQETVARKRARAESELPPSF